MDISIKRDGITLRGKLERAKDKDKAPIVIMFHGFTGDLGYTDDSLFSILVNKLTKDNISVIRFDFNGHGKSDGDFVNMDVLNELEDAIAILKYVKTLDFVTDIYVLGHSQGGVVAGLLAGLYSDVISKLVLLAPAATLKDDAIIGTCMDAKYDTNHIPDVVSVFNSTKDVGGQYFRIAKYLPIYEVTQNYKGPMLVVHGLNDDCVNVKASYRYKESIPSCKLEVFENLDHGISGEDHEKAIDSTIRFLCL